MYKIMFNINISMILGTQIYTIETSAIVLWQIGNLYLIFGNILYLLYRNESAHRKIASSENIYGLPKQYNFANVPG